MYELIGFLWRFVVALVVSAGIMYSIKWFVLGGFSQFLMNLRIKIWANRRRAERHPEWRPRPH